MWSDFGDDEESIGEPVLDDQRLLFLQEAAAIEVLEDSKDVDWRPPPSHKRKAAPDTPTV